MRLLAVALHGMALQVGAAWGEEEDVDPWQTPYAYWNQLDSNSIYPADYKRHSTPYPIHELSRPGVAAALFFTGATVSSK